MTRREREKATGRKAKVKNDPYENGRGYGQKGKRKKMTRMKMAEATGKKAKERK